MSFKGAKSIGPGAITVTDLDTYNKDVPFSSGRTPREKKPSQTMYIKGSKEMSNEKKKGYDDLNRQKTGGSELTAQMKKHDVSRHVTFKE